MNRKPVDLESLPILVPLLLGVPKRAVSVVNDGVRGYTGLRITRKDKTHFTFWYDWKHSKLQLLEVDSKYGNVDTTTGD